MKFNGIFKEYSAKIRYNREKMTSVHDFIEMIKPGENSGLIYENFIKTLDDPRINDRVYVDVHTFRGVSCAVVDIAILVELLLTFTCERSIEFRKTDAVYFIRHLGGGLNLMHKIKVKEEIVSPKQSLIFDGIFSGREHEIRITPDKKISVFDFIKVVGGQKNPKQTWSNIQNVHIEEVVQYLDHFKFEGCGQRMTPVISVEGMVKLLFWLPGESAKQFRSKSAEVMVRYLGGDTTLIDEIRTIDKEHVNNPDNIAQVFRQEVISNLLFNQDQINTSKMLINYYGRVVCQVWYRR
jgi:hypothetical protein